MERLKTMSFADLKAMYDFLLQEFGNTLSDIDNKPTMELRNAIYLEMLKRLQPLEQMFKV